MTRNYNISKPEKTNSGIVFGCNLSDSGTGRHCIRTCTTRKGLKATVLSLSAFISASLHAMYKLYRVVLLLRSKQVTESLPDTDQTQHSDRKRDGPGPAGGTGRGVGGGLEGGGEGRGKVNDGGRY